jgi:hypothetical protein
MTNSLCDGEVLSSVCGLVSALSAMSTVVWSHRNLNRFFSSIDNEAPIAVMTRMWPENDEILSLRPCQ